MGSPLGLVADTIPFSCVDGPGNRFVVFLQGCNFDCSACHNPQTIPLHAPHARTVTVAELVDEIRGPAPFLSGVTVSGGEATLQAPFLVELFTALKRDPDLGRLTTLVDTNGSAPPATWDEVAPVMDGAMVDLKSFDPVQHLTLTHHDLEPVLASIRHLAAIGRLHEVRLLVVPGVNDDRLLVEQTAAWLHGVDPAMTVKVIGFRRHGARATAQAWPEATADDTEAVAAVLRAAGLTRLTTV